ncbi:hypothetical protein B0H13DRAFT_1934182 [Mycena leptocephala]|nr:hypothetical protein B0H13DRAFT_1934182 [Mycena leptocephala]
MPIWAAADQVYAMLEFPESRELPQIVISETGRDQLSVQREKMNHLYRPWRPFFNGFYGSDPCRNRAVECLGKWPTERARHPWHGCRGTVPTGTGGSPTQVRAPLFSPVFPLQAYRKPRSRATKRINGILDRGHRKSRKAIGAG